MNAFKAIILLGLLGVIPYGSHGQPLRKEADKYFKSGKYSEALSRYAELLREKPEDTTLLLQAGLSALQSPFPDKAEKYLEKAFSLSRLPNGRLLYAYARALHINYQFEKAISFYVKADPERKQRGAIARFISECQSGKELIKNPIKIEIANLGKVINTSYHEYLPQVSLDQSQLYFTSRRPGNTGKTTAPDGLPTEDIYYASTASNGFESLTNLGPPINSKDNDACVGLSADGKTLFIYRGKNGGDIMVSQFDGKAWSKPMDFEYNTAYLETSASLSADGKHLFFVSDRAGNKDIYICRRSPSGKSWMAPQRMNGHINTLFDEESPYLHSDGRTLYFSSNGHNTMGGYDVFRAFFNDKGIYTGATNLGYPINTTSDDLFYRVMPDGKTAYFASERKEGYGGQDLYKLSLPDATAPNLAFLTGVVKDKKTGMPVPAQITVTDNDANAVVSTFNTLANDGKFAISLPSGKNYGIVVEKNGKLFYSRNVNTGKVPGYLEITIEVTLSDIEEGASVILNNLFFDVDKQSLRTSSIPELKLVEKLLRQYPALRIELSGHTDNTGTEERNKVLSQGRADEAKKYLTDQGIDGKRITAIGYSSSKPVATNQTEQGRQQNRRTELKITSLK